MSDLIAGRPYFTKDNGEIVTPAYLRARVRQKLAIWRRTLPASYTPERIQTCLAETIDNPAWLRGRNGETVGSLCRAVESYLLLETWGPGGREAFEAEYPQFKGMA